MNDKILSVLIDNKLKKKNYYLVSASPFHKFFDDSSVVVVTIELLRFSNYKLPPGSGILFLPDSFLEE